MAFQFKAISDETNNRIGAHKFLLASDPEAPMHGALKCL